MVMFDDAWPFTTVRFAAPVTFSQVHAVIECFDAWLVRGERFVVDVRLGNAFSTRAEAPVAQVLLGWARLRRREVMHRCGGIAWVAAPGRDTSLRLRFYAEAADALDCPIRVFTCRVDAGAWLRALLAPERIAPAP